MKVTKMNDSTLVLAVNDIKIFLSAKSGSIYDLEAFGITDEAAKGSQQLRFLIDSKHLKIYNGKYEVSPSILSTLTIESKKRGRKPKKDNLEKLEQNASNSVPKIIHISGADIESEGEVNIGSRTNGARNRRSPELPPVIVDADNDHPVSNEFIHSILSLTVFEASQRIKALQEDSGWASIKTMILDKEKAGKNRKMILNLLT